MVDCMVKTVAEKMKGCVGGVWDVVRKYSLKDDESVRE